MLVKRYLIEGEILICLKEPILLPSKKGRLSVCGLGEGVGGDDAGIEIDLNEG